MGDRSPMDYTLDKFTAGDGCWIWSAALNSHGYGQMNVLGKSLKAHRVVYQALTGKIPDGLDLDHLCRVRNCVRPSHLEPVTRRENLLRGVSPRMLIHKSGVCARGHIRIAKGDCPACRNLRERARYASDPAYASRQRESARVRYHLARSANAS